MPVNKPYCRPNEAGLASEAAAVAKRIARLLDAMHNEVNGFIVEGTICDELAGAMIRRAPLPLRIYLNREASAPLVLVTIALFLGTAATLLALFQQLLE